MYEEKTIEIINSLTTEGNRFTIFMVIMSGLEVKSLMLKIA